MTHEPHDPVSPELPVARTPRRPKRWRQVAGFVIGSLLLIAAVWAVASQDTRATWEPLRGAPAWMVAAAFLLPFLNWMLMSATFSALMKPHGAVGRAEMAALIGASWLLNYLPMRPGLLGRVAYHKAVNRIGVPASLKAVGGNIGAGFAAMGLGALVAASAGLRAVPSFAWVDRWPGVVAASALLPLLGACVGAGALRSPVVRSWTIASLLRYMDLLVWAARYAIVFRMIGRDVDLFGAIAIATVSQAASLVPIAGNGLGLREWAVGLTAAALPAWIAGDMGREVGLAADLVNRAAEVAAAVPVGMASVWWLVRRRRASAGAR